VNDLLFEEVIESDSQRAKEVFERVGADQCQDDPRQKVGLSRLDHVVDHDLDEPRGHEFHGGGETRQAESQQRERAMGPKVSKDSKERVHERVFSG